MFNTVLVSTLGIIIVLTLVLIISVIFYLQSIKKVFSENDEVMEVIKTSFEHSKQLEIKLYNLRKNVDELSTILSTKYTKK